MENKHVFLIFFIVLLVLGALTLTGLITQQSEEAKNVVYLIDHIGTIYVGRGLDSGSEIENAEEEYSKLSGWDKFTIRNDYKRLLEIRRQYDYYVENPGAYERVKKKRDAESSSRRDEYASQIMEEYGDLIASIIS